MSPPFPLRRSGRRPAVCRATALAVAPASTAPANRRREGRAASEAVQTIHLARRWQPIRSSYRLDFCAPSILGMKGSRSRLP